MVGVSQPIVYSVFDFANLMFGLLPSSRAVVAVILICVEYQKGGNQDGKNYYNCRSHRVTRGIPAHCAISANPNTRHAKLVRSRNLDLNQVFAAPVAGHGPPGCVLDQSQCSLIETVLETAGVADAFAGGNAHG